MLRFHPPPPPNETELVRARASRRWATGTIATLLLVATVLLLRRSAGQVPHSLSIDHERGQVVFFDQRRRPTGQWSFGYVPDHDSEGRLADLNGDGAIEAVTAGSGVATNSPSRSAELALHRRQGHNCLQARRTRPSDTSECVPC